MPGDNESFAAALGLLSDTLRDMRTDRIPPPNKFDKKGGSSIKDFFTEFERYCLTIYKGDHISWLQVLPSFLEGEAKSMVLAFGSSGTVTYQIVKDRLIKEFVDNKTLGKNPIATFFSTTRIPGESLTCFSIRLEAVASKIPDCQGENKATMVKSKFISALPNAILNQLNVQLGYQDSVDLEQIVRLATIIESQTVIPKTPVSAVVDVVAGEPLERTPIRCYGCGELGHIKSKCPQGLTCYKCREKGHIARNCKTAIAGTTQDRRECEYCGEGTHPLMRCQVFQQRFMSCVWCGNVDHASYLCPEKPRSGN